MPRRAERARNRAPARQQETGLALIISTLLNAWFLAIFGGFTWSLEYLLSRSRDLNAVVPEPQAESSKGPPQPATTLRDLHGLREVVTSLRQHGGSYCRQCMALDKISALTQYFETGRRSHGTVLRGPERTEYHVVCKLGAEEEWRPGMCRLCRFLTQLITVYDESQLKRYPTSPWELCLRRKQSDESPGALVLQNQMNPEFAINIPFWTSRGTNADKKICKQYSNRIAQSRIDFDVLRDWLYECKFVPLNESGGTRCESTTTPLEISLIDCSSRKIIAGDTRYKYAALSYLWGPPTGHVRAYQVGAELSSDMSPTIVDAGRVCAELGIFYLWVDRCCIDQGSKQKEQQLRNMHKIYDNAFVTLIATSGEGPDFGLAGVDKTDFMAQPSLILENTIMCAQPNGEETIRKSNWYHRGWTYQEMIFSHRRLYFTNSYVWFECPCSVCTRPAPDISNDDIPDLVLGHQRMRNLTIGQHFERAHSNYIRRPIDTLHGYITDYSPRILSYETDRLRAALGLLSALQDLKHPLHHVFSQPLDLKNDNVFLENLLWISESTSARRITGLPSWSWTGWIGLINMRPRYTAENFHASASNSFPLSNNTSVAYNDAATMRQLLHSPSPTIQPILRLTAWRIHLRFLHNLRPSPHDPEHGRYATFYCPIFSDRWHFYRLHLSVVVELGSGLFQHVTSQVFACMLLSTPADFASEKDVKGCIGLVLDDEGGYKRRIGVVIFEEVHERWEDCFGELTRRDRALDVLRRMRVARRMVEVR